MGKTCNGVPNSDVSFPIHKKCTRVDVISMEDLRSETRSAWKKLEGGKMALAYIDKVTRGWKTSWRPLYLRHISATLCQLCVSTGTV